jgi:acetyltransferase-like isoleucine patch superfamily enzyme
MKAYLVKTSTIVTPWNKLSFDLTLQHVSLLERLKRQFAQESISVQEVDESALTNLEDDRLICFAHTYLSDFLLKDFLKATQKQEKSLQCFVNKRAMMVFSGEEDSGPHPISLYFVKAQEKIKQAVPHLLEAEDIYQIHTGLPASILKRNNAVVPINPLVAIDVVDWSEYLLASSLFAREFTLKQLMLFNSFIPKQLLTTLTNMPMIARRIHQIGANCRIHPTAIIEGSIIGNNVEIGPYCYIKASIIGDNTSVREHSSIKLSVIGKNNFITTANLFNALIGDECFIFTQLLVNGIIGNRNFIGGGTGFSDFDFYQDMASIDLPAGKKQTLHKFLASAVGDDCYIGAGLIFKMGRVIPNRSNFINKNMIDQIPQKEGQHFLANQGKILTIPKDFLTK